MSNMVEKTLNNLRKACRAAGIKVKKETFSWGPHVSFSCADTGQSLSDCVVALHDVREKAHALDPIMEQFRGMEIDGQKVYGLGR